MVDPRTPEASTEYGMKQGAMSPEAFARLYPEPVVAVSVGFGDSRQDPYHPSPRASPTTVRPHSPGSHSRGSTAYSQAMPQAYYFANQSTDRDENPHFENSHANAGYQNANSPSSHQSPHAMGEPEPFSPQNLSFPPRHLPCAPVFVSPQPRYDHNSKASNTKSTSDPTQSTSPWPGSPHSEAAHHRRWVIAGAIVAAFLLLGVIGGTVGATVARKSDPSSPLPLTLSPTMLRATSAPTIAPTIPPSTSSPTGYKGETFTSLTELKLAVDDYMSDSRQDLTAKWGYPMNNWNVSHITSFRYLFDGLLRNEALQEFNEDISQWNVSASTDFTGMFRGAHKFNQDLSQWNVSRATTMAEMFQDANAFDSKLDEWDVSNVEDFTFMFRNATSLKSSQLANWNVKSALLMSGMFQFASNFESDLSKWQVAKVRRMDFMFSGASRFNSNLNQWDTSSVEAMDAMFQAALSFNGDVSTWQTSKVKYMDYMFHKAESFNQDISQWSTASVENTKNMFSSCYYFNQDLSDWDTIKVQNMANMFAFATAFNGDVTSWDVSNVQDMSCMLCLTSAFNQDISSWNVSAVKDMTNMFYQSKFKQNLCPWGEHLTANTVFADTFAITGCPNSGDPDFGRSPPGPFCFDCV